ncbi:MAG: hypothetical protein ABI183_07675 [Polyangiaceae bacterium]
MFLLASAALLFPSAGCALVLGLDSGNDVTDLADGEAGTTAPLDAAPDVGVGPADSGPKPPTCAPDTADCNGNSADGCETALNSPQHCGSCTKSCSAFQVCMMSVCCANMNQFCSGNADCCSNNCDGTKCGKP